MGSPVNSTRRFANQPLAVRIAVGLTLFNSWILFAEVVVAGG